MNFPNFYKQNTISIFKITPIIVNYPKDISLSINNLHHDILL